MAINISHCRRMIRVVAALAGFMAWSGSGFAQPSGQASAASISLPLLVTSIADTGSLAAASQPLAAAQGVVSIPGLLSAEAAHSAVMGWSDQVAAQSSLTSVALGVLGTGITANSIVSRALSTGSGGTGGVSIGGLMVGGIPVAVSGVPNQQISAPGLLITVNEQVTSAGGIVVNALRVRTLDGLTNIVLGSARAGM